jgi:hypothetical protein
MRWPARWTCSKVRAFAGDVARHWSSSRGTGGIVEVTLGFALCEDTDCRRLRRMRDRWNSIEDIDAPT